MPRADRTGADGAGFGVYVHWPFCAQKCPYCDFNSHVRHKGIDEARFRAAFLRELDYTAALIAPSPAQLSCATSPQRGEVRGCAPHLPLPGGERSEANANELPGEGAAHTTRSRGVSSIFFGGGTPSLMAPETVGAILDRIAGLWSIEPGAEITLEANPGSVEASRFRGYRTAGVNRVSLGVQSLRDDILKSLGRIHSVAEARAAIDIARSTFDRFSFDLIYARPGQTVAAWREELAEALSLAGRHISLYQLTIEPETPFAALHAAGKLVVPDEDLALAFYDVTQEMTAAAGLPALRDLQSRGAWRGEPAQPHLLALRRICRRRSGCAWAPEARRHPLLDQHRAQPGALGVADRSGRPRPHREFPPRPP